MVVSRLAFFCLLFGALSVAPCAAASAPAKAAPRNLLKNPGFEESIKGHEWMPTGWDTSRADMPSVFFGRDTLEAHGGRYAVSVANGSGVLPMSHNWSQTLLVDKELWGKDLVFTVWTKSNGVDGRAYIKLEAYRDTVSKMARTWGISRDDATRRLRINPVDDPLYDVAWKRQFFSETETPWVKRQVRVYVPPTSNVVFVRCGLIGTGQLVIDDATLTAEPAEPASELPLNANLLADPGFEKHDVNGWEYSLPPYAEMYAEPDSEIVHAGKYSVRFSSQSAAIVPGRAGVCQVFSNRNFSNKRVRLTAYIKTDSLRSSSAYIKVFSHGLSGIDQNAGNQIFSGTMDWGQATVEMDVPPDTFELWVWLSYTAPAPGRVYFDDASLQVLGPAGTQ